MTPAIYSMTRGFIRLLCHRFCKASACDQNIQFKAACSAQFYAARLYHSGVLTGEQQHDQVINGARIKIHAISRAHHQTMMHELRPWLSSDAIQLEQTRTRPGMSWIDVGIELG